LPRSIYLNPPATIQAITADESTASQEEQADSDETDEQSTEEETGQTADGGLGDLIHNLRALDSPLKPQLVPLRSREQHAWSREDEFPRPDAI